MMNYIDKNSIKMKIELSDGLSLMLQDRLGALFIILESL